MDLIKLLKQADEEDIKALRDLYFGLENTNRKLYDLFYEVEDYPCLQEVLKRLFKEYSCHHFTIANWWELFIEDEGECKWFKSRE